jgi:hypothetical protein
MPPYRDFRGFVAFAPEYRKFPVIFPVSREFTVENGSLVTAPTASEAANFFSKA